MLIGVDPGKQGGLVCLNHDGGLRSYATMPTTELDLIQWFRGTGIKRTQMRSCYMEKVHSMPGQGVASMFTFGVGYGGLRMAAVACGMKLIDVRPQAWQKAMGVSPRKKSESKTEFKDRLRGMAQQLFPDSCLWTCNKKTQLAVCDAMLIAEYGRREEK